MACSGLVKVTGNYSDLFWGHSAWFIYQVRSWRATAKGPLGWRAITPVTRFPPGQGTNRIFKNYDFSGLSNPAALGRVMSFSSCT